MVNDETQQAPEHFHLELVQVSCGDQPVPRPR
jgi:2-isopropylmalate synthase